MVWGRGKQRKSRWRIRRVQNTQQRIYVFVGDGYEITKATMFRDEQHLGEWAWWILATQPISLVEVRQTQSCRHYCADSWRCETDGRSLSTSSAPPNIFVYEYLNIVAVGGSEITGKHIRVVYVHSWCEKANLLRLWESWTSISLPFIVLFVCIEKYTRLTPLLWKSLFLVLWTSKHKEDNTVWRLLFGSYLRLHKS